MLNGRSRFAVRSLCASKPNEGMVMDVNSWCETKRSRSAASSTMRVHRMPRRGGGKGPSSSSSMCVPRPVSRGVPRDVRRAHLFVDTLSAPDFCGLPPPYLQGLVCVYDSPRTRGLLCTCSVDPRMLRFQRSTVAFVVTADRSVGSWCLVGGALALALARARDLLNGEVAVHTVSKKPLPAQGRTGFLLGSCNAVNIPTVRVAGLG